MTDDPGPARAQALERLAASLDPADYATTLTTGPGHGPRLSVTNRHAQIGDVIRADHRAYWWSWGGMDRAGQRPGDRRPHDQRDLAGPAAARP